MLLSPVHPVLLLCRAIIYVSSTSSTYLLVPVQTYVHFLEQVVYRSTTVLRINRRYLKEKKTKEQDSSRFFSTNGARNFIQVSTTFLQFHGSLIFSGKNTISIRLFFSRFISTLSDKICNADLACKPDFLYFFGSYQQFLSTDFNS